MTNTVTAVQTSAQSRYAALSFADKPALYADAAPLKTAAGAAVVPPYVVLRADEGSGGEWMGEQDRIEVVRLDWDIYAPTKSAARDIAAGISYNGEPPTAREGFDDAEALTLPTGYILNKCERQGPGKGKQDRKRGSSANLEYQLTITHFVEVMVSGSGT